MKSIRQLLLGAALLGAVSFAQTATTTSLTGAVKAALPINADVKTAQANLNQAQGVLQATQADPSSLVTEKLSATNGVSLSQAQLRAAQLATLQTTITDYVNVLEAQENVNLQTLQVQVLTKALQVAKVKLSTGNATNLDVQTAQNSLSGGQQNLVAAQAQLNLASSKLATQMGVSGPVRAAGAPNVPKLSTSLSSLQAARTRLSTLVAVNNALAVAQLNVKLTDNDFTPAQTKQQAQTALANAQRNVTTAQQNTSQALSSAYQSALNTTELLKVTQSKEAAAQKQYTQDAARLKSGTISAVELQSSQLTLKQAQYARLQAQDNVLSALAALSVAAGQNLTGISY
ncbi:TolC family protein [Deinococcus sp.]|uniref:TolC family protein n=1 Tax=Deinococcus sp. TaxID=47478 RepID=UPI0025C33DC2|nr:TolC family protein [Deinococcus sp.]